MVVISLLVSCSEQRRTTVVNYPLNKAFVYNNKIEIAGTGSKDEKKQLTTELDNYWDDSIRIRSIQKFGFFYKMKQPAVFEPINLQRSISFMNAFLQTRGFYRASFSDSIRVDTVGDQLQTTLFEALEHPNNATFDEAVQLQLVADGAVQPQKVVTSGTITIDRASSIIHIGLPIEADLQSLPLAMGIDNGMGQGRYKNVNKAWLRVYQSSGIFIGPDPDNLVEAKQRTTEPYGTPPELKTQEIQIMLTPSWLDSGQVFIRQSDPLPLTIVGMTLEVAIGG